MSKKKSGIKFMNLIKEPIERKRDGQMQTHWMRINLTTEEACVISEMFERNREKGEPSFSLARAVLLHMATVEDPEEYINEALANVKYRATLAERMAENEISLAQSLMREYKAKKTTVPEQPKPVSKPAHPPVVAPKPAVIPSPAKPRREYVPEPRRK